MTIINAGIEHAELLSTIGKTSFLQAHGQSASKEDIATYVNKTYTPTVFADELSNKTVNVELSKKHGQLGIWLNVWVENQKAIRFYTKCGFKNVGSYDFKISENHTNPNHVLFLEY